MTSRRIFLKSGAMTMLSLGFAPSFLARTAAATSGRRRLLIAIFQRGAVDGLNMIVPYGEDEYYKLRPTIAVPKPGVQDGAIALDDFFGLHPRMGALKPLWDNKSLAIVHASGSPDRTRSHFDAQDYMESGTPGVKSTRDGWLNRYLQVSATDPSPLRGIAVARQMPRAMQGKAPSLAFGGVDAFDVRGGMDSQQSFERAFSEADNPLLRGTAKEAFEAMKTLRTIGTPYRPAAEYPRSPFSQALQEIARVAKADIGLEVAFAESTNWDHHVNEGSTQGQIANRLDDLAGGLAALSADLGERMSDTVILTMSEFGRAAQENGNRGTDHGHGNAMMIIGGPVKGGHVYGKWPGLKTEQRYEGRDLAITTDFRDVFSEIVTSHLGLKRDGISGVLPGYAPTHSLGLIRA
jgi:uncharacterized protein (DUF1501 family)